MSELEKLQSMVAGLAAKVDPDELPAEVKELLAAREGVAAARRNNNQNHNNKRAVASSTDV